MPVEVSNVYLEAVEVLLVATSREEPDPLGHEYRVALFCRLIQRQVEAPAPSPASDADADGAGFALLERGEQPLLGLLGDANHGWSSIRRIGQAAERRRDSA